MGDYIQRLYPEDSMQAHAIVSDDALLSNFYRTPSCSSQCVSFRLKERKAQHQSSHQSLRYLTLRKLLDGDKGPSQTVSLWCFATDARDPMQDVMIRRVVDITKLIVSLLIPSRLHSYIRKICRILIVFRYAPDRPPPANPVTNGTNIRLSICNQQSDKFYKERMDEHATSNTPPLLKW